MLLHSNDPSFSNSLYYINPSSLSLLPLANTLLHPPPELAQEQHRSCCAAVGLGNVHQSQDDIHVRVPYHTAQVRLVQDIGLPLVLQRHLHTGGGATRGIHRPFGVVQGVGLSHIRPILTHAIASHKQRRTRVQLWCVEIDKDGPLDTFVELDGLGTHMYNAEGFAGIDLGAGDIPVEVVGVPLQVVGESADARKESLGFSDREQRTVDDDGNGRNLEE